MIIPGLTLLLLNMTCPVLANSVDPDQLASSEIRSGHGILIYSVRLGLKHMLWVLNEKASLSLVWVLAIRYQDYIHAPLEQRNHNHGLGFCYTSY